jgi:hypothetical protein
MALPNAQGPECAEVVLCLDGTERGNDLRYTDSRSAADDLVREARTRDARLPARASILVRRGAVHVVSRNRMPAKMANDRVGHTPSLLLVRPMKHARVVAAAGK